MLRGEVGLLVNDCPKCGYKISVFCIQVDMESSARNGWSRKRKMNTFGDKVKGRL